MTSTDQLKKTLESLPTLDERLHTWQRLIKELDFYERDQLNLCLNNLELGMELNGLKDNRENLLMIVENYEQLFDGLVKRLNIPLAAYSDRISELSGEQFRLKAKQFRIDEDLRCKKRALDLSAESYQRYRQGSVWDYIKTQESAVNGWHFTPGIMNYSNDLERKISYEEFVGFNPDSYAKEFSVELRELFKQQGLI